MLEQQQQGKKESAEMCYVEWNARIVPFRVSRVIQSERQTETIQWLDWPTSNCYCACKIHKDGHTHTFIYHHHNISFCCLFMKPTAGLRNVERENVNVVAGSAKGWRWCYDAREESKWSMSCNKIKYYSLSGTTAVSVGLARPSTLSHIQFDWCDHWGIRILL